MAQELNVSRNHLVKVIHFMALQGWVKTTRGKGGGVALAHAPESYRLGKIIREMEDHVDKTGQLVKCDAARCIFHAGCTLNPLLSVALERFYEELDKHSLKEAIRYPQFFSQLSASSAIPVTTLP